MITKSNDAQKNDGDITTNSNYDIIIVGGGMVGASLAVALKPLGYRIGLVDAFCFGQQQQPSYDDRSIALSYGSHLIYRGMGLWDALQSGVTAIKQIHISTKGRLGAARLTAEKENLPALGYLVQSRILGAHLYQELKNSSIELISPATITEINTTTESLEITLDKQGSLEKLNCQLLVAADGTRSKVRQLMGGAVDTEPYHQSAIVANVTPEKTHDHCAFERFTTHGPIALLPLTENRCSLVWTHRPEEVEQILQLTDDEFLQRLQKSFGYRLGRFVKTGKRSAFPLALSQSQQITSTRTVLIGNSAQTLHPVAGQGLNLGLRDVAQLAELLANKEWSLASDTSEMLQVYAEARQPDRNTVIKYTDSLVKLFSNESELLAHSRAVGLMLVDRLPPLRRLLTSQSMGFRHRKTRLARGLSL